MGSHQEAICNRTPETQEAFEAGGDPPRASAIYAPQLARPASNLYNHIQLIMHNDRSSSCFVGPVILSSALSFSTRPCHSQLGPVILNSALSFSTRPCHSQLGSVILNSALSFSTRPCHSQLGPVILNSVLSFSTRPCHSQLSPVILNAKMYEKCNGFWNG